MKLFNLLKINLVYFILFLHALSYSQSLLITYPENPEALNICSDETYLYARIDIASTTSNGAEINITFPDGIEYIQGSIIKTGGTGTLIISENGGTPNSPIFSLSPNINTGDFIEFKLKRTAKCIARDTAVSGDSINDNITVTLNQSSTSSFSPTYSIVYPTLTLVQPDIVTGAIINGNYSRTFTITNGSEGCANSIYFSIEYPNGSVNLQSLTLDGQPITPVSTSGNITFYEITGNNLTDDQLLCNGETLTFTENFTLTDCNITDTKYKTGWGCSENIQDWCQISEGTGAIALEEGLPDFTSHTQTRVNFVDMCTPFLMKTIFRNGGTGDLNATTMYDVKIKKGVVYPGYPISNYDHRILLGDSTVNGNPTPHTDTGIYVVDLNDLFTTDPDGAGQGLEDIDGDGYYDDLPPGYEFTLLTEMSFTCTGDCDLKFRTYQWGSAMGFKTMCNRDITEQYHGEMGYFTFLQEYFEDGGYIPANIENNEVFNVTMRVNFYRNYNPYMSLDSRWKYVLTLAPGVSVVGNAKWFSYYNNVTTETPINYTLNGNELTIISPPPASLSEAREYKGWCTIDLTYDCSNGETLSMDWEFFQINNINTDCHCFEEVLCGNLTTLPHCDTGCQNGISTSTPIIRRADNSLGWTDNTMTTRQTVDNISDYDLSKALYLDEIEIHFNGTQVGNSPNLFSRLELDKAYDNGNRIDKLTTLNMDVVIKRNGNTIVDTNTSNFNLSNSTTELQAIDWDLTDILPPGGLLDGDKIETIAHYQVATNKLTRHDTPSGKRIFMYNKDPNTGDDLICTYYIPEMYLVGTYTSFGTNPYRVYGCQENTLGGSSNYLARRFDAGGYRFYNEFRPGMLINKLVIKVPSGYDLLNVRFIGYAYHGEGTVRLVLTPASIVSNPDGSSTVTFLNDDGNGNQIWPPLETTVMNSYGALFPTKVIAKCNTETIENIYRKFSITDYYYHYAEIAPPLPPEADTYMSKSTGIALKDKAALELSDQTGSIQATKFTESWNVRLFNSGYSTSPYNWIAINDVPGVNITSVTRISDGTIITPSTYNGGKMFHLSDTGIPSAEFEDYQINFTYTTCEHTTIDVLGGWNCTSFPDSPDDYPCGMEQISLDFTPVDADIEIGTLLQPSDSVDICDDISYEFYINNTQAGNTVNNTFTIISSTGIQPVQNSFEAEYPAESGNWQPINGIINGQNIVYDLTTHPAYPSQGLPGIVNDQGDPNNRKMIVRFDMETNCDFVSGSTISVKTDANKTCGVPISNNASIQTLPININDVNIEYIVANNLEIVDPSFTSCNSPVTIEGKHTIISSTAIGVTGYIEIRLPESFLYVDNSFICTSNTFCPTFAGITTTNTGEQIIRLNIPQGMVTGDYFTYTIEIEEDDTNLPDCGDQTINVFSLDTINEIPCATDPNGTCSTITIKTGEFDLDFNVDRAILNFPNNPTTTAIVNFNSENLEIEYTIENNSTTLNSESNIPVEVYYDANQNNLFDDQDTLIDTHVIPNAIPFGNSITDTINLTISSDKVCNLLLVVRYPNTCICDTVFSTVTPPDLLDGVAIDNITICQEDNILIGTNSNNALTYKWTPNTYLNDDTSPSPAFHYTGTTLTTATDFTYQVEITRPNGCTSTDEITITIDDTENPTASNPTPLTVECIGDVPASDITVVTDEADNCTANPVVAFVREGVTGDNCSQTIIRVYSVTDDFNNSINVTQTITVIDTIDPTASNPASITVECIADVPPADITVVTNEADNCTANPVVAFVGDVSDGNTCPETITRTYSVTDDCNNSINVTQTITVIDTIDPTASNPAPITVECIGDVPASDITVVTDEADNCTANPVVAFVREDVTGDNCSKTITRTYSVTDDCGNSINVTQTITVIDTIDPTASNPAPITVECIGDVPASDITVVTDEADNCTANPTVAFVSDIPNGNSYPKIITRTYSVTDDCNNSINVTQSITVLFGDIVPPTTTNFATQYFCEYQNPTLQNIQVTSPDTGNVFWYNSQTDTTILNTNTQLVDGQTYYAAQSDGSCAERTPIKVYLRATIEAPTGDATLYYCNFPNLTLGDLAINTTLDNAQLTWFDINDNTSTPLLSTTPVIHNHTYYVFQNLESCAESLAIKVITDCQPNIELIKEASDVYCRNQDNVLFNLTVKNTGNIPLSNITITDANLDTTTFSIATINPNETETISDTHTISSNDRLYGLIINSANVSATAIDNGATVSDISDDPNEPTGNNDPNIIFIDSDCDGIIDIIDIDDDNDGILDTVENNGIDPTSDADGDGVYQYLDADDNNPNVGLNTNNMLDTDRDNIPNHLDIDSDNDGLPDNIEAQSTNDYIIPSYTINNNGLDIAYENTTGITPQDTDQDGIPDYLDNDSDNDNVPDAIEGHDYDFDGYPDNTSEGRDSDFDGLDDGYEGTNIYDPYLPNDEINDPVNLPDTDEAPINNPEDVNYRDIDDDNDGTPTYEEDFNHDQDYVDDNCDGDNLPDYLDPDLCEIIVPNLFSPNDDGLSDLFVIEGLLLSRYKNFELRIFDRWGGLLYDYKNNGRTNPIWWNGTYKNNVVPSGVYYYTVQCNDGETEPLVGFIQITR